MYLVNPASPRHAAAKKAWQTSRERGTSAYALAECYRTVTTLARPVPPADARKLLTIQADARVLEGLDRGGEAGRQPVVEGRLAGQGDGGLADRGGGDIGADLAPQGDDGRVEGADIVGQPAGHLHRSAHEVYLSGDRSDSSMHWS